MLAATSFSERQADRERLRATGLQVAAAGRKSGGRALAWDSEQGFRPAGCSGIDPRSLGVTGNRRLVVRSEES